ncbi:TonB-dependent receptor, partial [Bacteroides thetaiotaomicron]
WKIQGEYKNTFGDIHDIQIMAGSEIRKNWVDNQGSTGYGYDPKKLTFQNLIFKDEAQANDWNLKTKSYKENAFASFFANGSYTLMNRYTLGGSVRMDGSDLFGVDKKYRFLPIYSVSGLWRLSNESFIRQYKWVDNLALRLSYGLQGNIDKGTSPFLVGKYDNVNILPGYSEENIIINSAPNSKLRWEKTASYNLGMDFSVLNQAINLSVDYYYRKGTDLIGSKALALENGFTNMSINWASMENKGVEINLQTRNITTKNFSWYTTFNFAYNQNKVLKVLTDKSQVTPSLEGYPVGAIFALKTKGINPDTGQIYLENKEGKAVTVEELFRMTSNEDGLG